MGAGCNTLVVWFTIGPGLMFIPMLCVLPPLLALLGVMPLGPFGPPLEGEELELVPNPNGLILSTPRLNELGRRVRDRRCAAVGVGE